MPNPLVAGFDHIATATANLDAALAFYKRMFDLEPLPGHPVTTPDGRRLAVLRVGPGPVLQIVETGKVAAPELVDPPGAVFYGSIRTDHASFAAADEASFEEIRQRLIAAGASKGEVFTFGASRSFAFKDPDGWLSKVVLAS